MVQGSEKQQGLENQEIVLPLETHKIQISKLEHQNLFCSNALF